MVCKVLLPLCRLLKELAIPLRIVKERTDLHPLEFHSSLAPAIDTHTLCLLPSLLGDLLELVDHSSRVARVQVEFQITTFATDGFVDALAGHSLTCKCNYFGKGTTVAAEEYCWVSFLLGCDSNSRQEVEVVDLPRRIQSVFTKSLRKGQSAPIFCSRVEENAEVFSVFFGHLPLSELLCKFFECLCTVVCVSFVVAEAVEVVRTHCEQVAPTFSPNFCSIRHSVAFFNNRELVSQSRDFDFEVFCVNNLGFTKYRN